MDNLESKIELLIGTKQEGEYWDFKQCYHTSNSALLHDIICMANNRSNMDGYIIFGIEDKTFEIIGVEEDKNRKNQQNIIDFLNGKHFARGIRPTIQLVTLQRDNHVIDVLVIKNTLDTPYYLTKNYKDKNKDSREVRAYYIS